MIDLRTLQDGLCLLVLQSSRQEQAFGPERQRQVDLKPDGSNSARIWRQIGNENGEKP